jgi:long-chain-fatty-acid--CoA ligase ACSBG
LAESKHYLSGAAPMTLNTLKFFKKLNINICEAYGMSECCGAQTLGHQVTNKLGSVGNTLNGYNKTFLFEKDEKGNGEICMFGRNVFMGYLNNEEKTKEALDSDGWLHSGDIGRTDENGFLFITGRLKELVIGAGGENIAPVPIEDNIKAELPQLISNVILIGDKRKYLIVLVSLQVSHFKVFQYLI